MTLRHTWITSLALGAWLAGPAQALTSSYQATLLLPPTSGGGPGVMEGDLVAVPGGAGGIL